jgi:hypothetical protein
MAFDAFDLKLVVVTATVDHDYLLTIVWAVVANFFARVPAFHDLVANILAG